MRPDQQVPERELIFRQESHPVHLLEFSATFTLHPWTDLVLNYQIDAEATPNTSLPQAKSRVHAKR